MKNNIPFEINSSGTEGLIIEAAYKALLEHGHVDITIKKIGDELPKSTSIIYTYYDSKDDLLFTLLQHLLRWFELEEIKIVGNPHNQLIKSIESMLKILNEESDRNGFAAIAELRANTKRSIRFQDRFKESDSEYKRYFTTLIERGIEKEQYKSVNPEPIASFLYSSIIGELSLHCMSKKCIISGNVKSELRSYIQSRLLASEEPQEDNL